MNFPFSQKDIELKFVYETLTFFKTYIIQTKLIGDLMWLRCKQAGVKKMTLMIMSKIN